MAEGLFNPASADKVQIEVCDLDRSLALAALVREFVFVHFR